ncbi:MAG TPA: hypothetical protein VGI61_04935, partial [Parafilimonas sp.]
VMKFKAILCMAIIVVLAACTKTNVKPETNAISASSTDNSIVKTRSAYLTAHPWRYQGFYFHYVDQQHKGDPQYVRGAGNNILNLDATKYLFKKNGSFVEFDGGYTYPGTWKFTDNTASLLILDYTYWKDNDSVLVLNNTACNYTEPMGYHDKSYTELIPLQ